MSRSHALNAEYKVDADYVGTDFQVARWITCDDEKKLAEFRRLFEASLAEDADGFLSYLAPSVWKLNYTEEQWPRHHLPQDTRTYLTIFTTEHTKKI